MNIKNYFFIILIPVFLACTTENSNNITEILTEDPTAAVLDLEEITEGETEIGNASFNIYLQFPINTSGIYKVTYSGLLASGVDPDSADLSRVQLKNRGNIIPLFVYDANANGFFDPEDYIKFYAKQIDENAAEYEYTETNIYRLTIGTGGNSIEEVDASNTDSYTLLNNHLKTIHSEENSKYYRFYTSQEGADHWFWDDYLNANEGSTSVNYEFTINNIDTTVETASLEVLLKGKSSDTENPDHHTKIYINDILIDDQTWDSTIEFTHETTFDSSILMNGTNSLKLESVGDTGASVDYLYMNYFEISYYQQFIAIDDYLEFTLSEPGNYHLQISSFSTSDIEIFEITDQANTKKIINPTINNEADTYSVTFELSTDASSSFIVQAISKAQAVDNIETVFTTNLIGLDNQADYIMIVYDDFYDNIEPLAYYHTTMGLNVKAVKISEVYNDFNYGIESPQAIKDFLEYAYSSWQSPAPQYVLLVGDATYDHKDNYAAGNQNFIPTHFYYTSDLGPTPSDNWFVSVSGSDNLPDMHIGRLTAQNTGEVDIQVNKILNYYLNQPFEWNQTMQFITDDEDRFEDVSNTIISDYVPEDYTVHTLYLEDYGDVGADLRSDWYENMATGTLITNYIGHGCAIALPNQMIESVAQVAEVENESKPTFLTFFSCLSGFFPLVLTSPDSTAYRECLAEAFMLQENKGAIATFSSTSMDVLENHEKMAYALFDAFFIQGYSHIGAATSYAITSAYEDFGASEDFVQAFSLLGDPAMELIK
ncbi:MAG: C25 family cysteine peptidase [Pseudomonadota bacterium]